MPAVYLWRMTLTTQVGSVYSPAAKSDDDVADKQVKHSIDRLLTTGT